ncbi:MAG: hypothetical protein LCH99_13820 [Proteobacteria bacterium]|jgi:electron transfer flavoprotein alpha/beta subunit|nr:hypothetical protein [Pseudomonadota bacterium]
MARSDARAIELALASFGEEHVMGLHAACTVSPVLRDYTGLGLRSVLCMNIRPGVDPADALIERLGAIRPDVVLCGQSAETGRGTGMMAYACAEALGYPVIANVRTITQDGGELVVTQDMGKGRYRELRGPCPVVLALEASQPPRRLPAMTYIRTGRIDIETHMSATEKDAAVADIRPARVRPRKSSQGAVSVIREPVIADLDPDRAAARILQYLRTNNIIQ